MDYLRNVCRICIECVWNIPHIYIYIYIYIEDVWNMYGICEAYVWNTYVWNMYRTCMEYVWNMYGTSKNMYWICAHWRDI